MKAKYSINKEQIDNMSMTISITMTVDQWREVMRTKTDARHYEPFCKVQTMISAALGDLTNAVEKNYSVDEWLKKDVD